jgi:hypothetical protein
MATKQQWLDYLKAEAQWVEDMKEWVKKKPEGEINTEVSTQDGGTDNPPIKPPLP